MAAYDQPMSRMLPIRGGGFRHRIAAAGRVGEAALLLTAASAAQRWVPMRRWSPVLGHHGPIPPSWPATWPALRSTAGPADSPVTPADHRVRVALRRALRLTPWQPSCLAQATAAQVMLRRRGAAGVVVIGLRAPSPPTSTLSTSSQPAAGNGGSFEADGQQWAAHAWLLRPCGVLVGGAAAAGFSPTTAFEVRGGPRAAELRGPR
jgi:hypothetical protein